MFQINFCINIEVASYGFVQERVEKELQKELWNELEKVSKQISC